MAPAWKGAIPRGTGREGELSVEQLVNWCADFNRRSTSCNREERLKQQLKERDDQNPTQRLDEEYSLKAEEQRSRGKRRKKQKSPRRGRRSTEEKLAEADRHEDVFPPDAAPEDCTLHRSRVGLADRARPGGPGGVSRLPQPSVRDPHDSRNARRSEYGIEISVALAFMVFMLRLSMDKVCRQLEFFWGLKLSKSQADALLNQLARAWEPEFEMLCTLLANSAVVHADETAGVSTQCGRFSRRRLGFSCSVSTKMPQLWRRCYQRICSTASWSVMTRRSIEVSGEPRSAGLT